MSAPCTQNPVKFGLEDGSGAGPAVWCHGLKPDQHAFRGSYGGWVFPFRNHSAESSGHFLRPALLSGLAVVYGRPVTPLDAFDTILALLSATSYTTRFAFDLEDDFPHVPFPAEPDAFAAAARIGARIRELQSFAAPPAAEFRVARLVGKASGPALDVPTPQRAFAAADDLGTIALLSDRSLCIAEVRENVWCFSVSGYPVLYRWLRARKGELLTGPSGASLLRAALDVAWRINELLFWFDEADRVLARALEAPLTRADLALPARDGVVAFESEDDEPD
jgi:Type ISP C-terminal specificity domain